MGHVSTLMNANPTISVTKTLSVKISREVTCAIVYPVFTEMGLFAKLDLVLMIFVRLMKNVCLRQEPTANVRKASSEISTHDVSMKMSVQLATSAI